MHDVCELGEREYGAADPHGVDRRSDNEQILEVEIIIL